MVIVAVVIIIALAVLVDLAYNCADTGARCTADDGPLQAAAEECAEDRSAACADKGSRTGTDDALNMIAVVIGAGVITGIVVLTIMAASANPIIKVGILVPGASILGSGTERKKAGGQQKRSDEHSFSYLHHEKLDANLGDSCESFF